MAVNVYGKNCYDWNLRFWSKIFFFVFIYLLYSVHTFPRIWHVSLFCFFSISGIAPLITCFDLQFKNIFKKFWTSLMYLSCSVFQILLQMFLLFNFLSVIRNMITVNVLIVSRCQTIVWVLLLITLKEYNHLKRDWN